MKNNITKSQKFKIDNPKSTIDNRKSKILTWVYPLNNWVSNYNKTFVYGWSNPKAKLFVSVGAGFKPTPTKPAHTTTKIKIFPDGNFAQTIKLPKKKNVVSLVQILDQKRTILKRTIFVGATFTVAQNKNWAGARPAPTKKYHSQNEMVIVIDPGHGGKEHGTHSPKGVPEKYFNLQIAKMLVRALHATPLQKVFLTRTQDIFLSLKDRINCARKKNANILISIHHNALPDNEDPLKHKGVGVYYTHNFVKPFAKKLLQSISKESGLNKYGIFKRDFALTRPDFCYAVLIECGFLIHPVEGEYVIRKDIQKKIVKGIVKGIIK